MRQNQNRMLWAPLQKWYERISSKISIDRHGISAIAFKSGPGIFLCGSADVAVFSVQNHGQSVFVLDETNQFCQFVFRANRRPKTQIRFKNTGKFGSGFNDSGRKIKQTESGFKP